ncbi:MAG TPA: extracellular solute-binding protein [Oxalicibacterium sp.]|jgi:phosphoglycerate transport regulatory protein PgtC|nr:extracellular solute-binding protein [Oxalicibacterium sp.]
MRLSFSFHRLLSIAAFAVACAQAHAQDVGKVIVLTSYPDAMTALYKSAFEKTHPGMQLEFLRQHSNEAAKTLRQPDQGKVDVYWAAAQRNFIALAKDGAFRHLDMPLGGLPVGIDGAPISDPAFYYAAFEVASYGFAINPDRLQKKNLPEPKDWTDLTDPAWQDEIIFPQPSKVGFAPMMLETILQGYGWERGWCILHAIGANAQLLGERGSNMADDIAKAQASVGISIDFFINTAIAKGAPLRFVYPDVHGYSPGQIAIMRQAPHAQNAEDFVSFVLSPEGQKLLFDPAVRRLPVRPSVYAAKPEGYFDPFAAKPAMPAVFNAERAWNRQQLDKIVFDALITDTQLQLRETLRTVAKAEHLAADASDPSLKDKARQARLLACAMPFNAVQATGMAERFADDPEVKSARNADLVAQWKKQARQNRDKAERLAEQVIAAAH